MAHQTEFILLVLLGVIGIATAILANWLRRPTWLPTWHIVTALCVLAMLATIITLLEGTDAGDTRPGTAKRRAPTDQSVSNPRGGKMSVPPNSTAVTELAPELVGA